MTATELYEKVVLLSSIELVKFLDDFNSSVRLTFLQSSINASNNKAFSGIVRVLSQLQLQDEIVKSAEIQSLYTHLAFYFKKADKRPLVDACATNILESIFKRRLSAWLHYKRYINHTSHISEFNNYLVKLSAARIDGDEDYTYEILGDLHEYRYRTIMFLPDEIKSKMITLFQNEDLAILFPILKQLHEEELNQLPNIEVSEYIGKEYVPSLFAESIFKEKFIDYVVEKRLFGYDIAYATEQIIKKGQANFDEKFAALTASDVVKVYCYCNMRMHYFSSLCLYERSEITPIFYKTSGRIKFIDIGCGPGTCGLAFAEHIYELTGVGAAFDYFGIDTSITMQRQAKEMMDNDVFVKSNSIEFYTNITQINLNSLANASCIVFNACYVFASNSLPIEAIADFIKEIKKKFPYTPKYLLFQNPSPVFLNERYLAFKKLLDEYEIQFCKKETISYYNQRKLTDIAKRREIYYEIIKL